TSRAGPLRAPAGGQLTLTANQGHWPCHTQPTSPNVSWLRPLTSNFFAVQRPAFFKYRTAGPGARGGARGSLWSRPEPSLFTLVARAGTLRDCRAQRGHYLAVAGAPP